MKRSSGIITLGAVVVGVAGIAGAVTATQSHPADATSVATASSSVTQTPPPARITMAQARVTALGIAPGEVVDAEYENEDGGWRYSFDIRQNGRVHEVGIDANSGAVVENVMENAADEAAEAAADNAADAERSDGQR